MYITITMPEWFQSYLNGLTKEQKSDLGCWILQSSDDNDLTTQIITVIDPGDNRLLRPEDIHANGCVCADCSGAELTADND